MTMQTNQIPVLASDGRPIADHIEPFFYNPHGSPKYWMKQVTGNYTALPGGEDIKRHLTRGGLSSKIQVQPNLSEIQEAVAQIQIEKQIYFSGALAGYQKGVYEFTNGRGLVTSSPNLVEPKKGDFPIIKTVLYNLLGPTQLPYFEGWLQVAVQTLRSNSRRTGQAIVLAGKRGCGKSLIQNQLITPLVGGRASKPYPWMTGKTAFNSDVFKGEHLIIEDEYGSTDIRSRRQFGANLKQVTANEEQHFHQKGIEAMVVKPFWRLSISVNDEPENLAVLPVLDESVKDKIMLFRCTKANMPMSTATDEQREEFARIIKRQLPCYLDYLLNDFVIPVELQDQRFGIKHYHDPEILGSINEMSPEEQLLEILLTHYRVEEHPMIKTNMDNIKYRELTSVRIYQNLTEQYAPFNRAANKILPTIQSVKTYMNRLADQYPARVQKAKFNNGEGWILNLHE